MNATKTNAQANTKSKRNARWVVLVFFMGLLMHGQIALAQQPALETGGTPPKKKASAENGDDKQDREDSAKEGDWLFEFTSGLGYTSNAYESPGKPYNDPNAGLGINTYPVVYSGLYVPVKLDMKTILSKKNDVTKSLNINTDAELGFGNLSNATVFKTEFLFNSRTLLNQEGKKKDIFSWGLFLRNNRNTYVDHDSGLPKNAGGNNVSSRFSYTSIGANLLWKQRTTSTRYKIDAEFENRDYATIQGMSEYDHTVLDLKGAVEFELSDDNDLTLELGLESDQFTVKSARDLSAASNGPPLRYDFLKFKSTWHSKWSKSFSSFLDLAHEDRTDTYMGYFNYARNDAKIRMIFQASDDLKIRFTYLTWTRSYPNAFAFDVPGNPHTQYDVQALSLKAEYQASDDFSYGVEIKSHDQKTNDLRYNYTKSNVELSATWLF
ncbi:MAG: hypothetical protein OEV94_07415 [Deltaproteobacteria bacterium]|nr:hypothetical protein [Deltaproteobacteria bacterium]